MQAAVLGVVQGLTEFLPISSSAHLYVIPILLGWTYAGPGVRRGAALGHADRAAAGIRQRVDRAHARRLLRRSRAALRGVDHVVQAGGGLGPGAVAGVLLEDLASHVLRSLPIQAAMLVIFGFLLWAVDRMRAARAATRTFRTGATCMWMGLAQAVALVPGVSRSGITITAGRAAGLSRVSAARFSFLLATHRSPRRRPARAAPLHSDTPPAALLVGIVTSAIVGLLAIRLPHPLSRPLGIRRCSSRTAPAFAALIVWRLVAR
jgi:undecaprenyl-diphosphatase